MGVSHFSSPGQTLLAQFKSKERHMYYAALTRNNIIDPQTLAAKYKKQSSVLAAILRCNARDPDTLESLKMGIQEELDDLRVPADDQEIIKPIYESYLNCNFGNKHEDAVLEKWSDDTGKVIKTDQFAFKHHIFTRNGYNVVMNGRLDGLTECGRIVEVKNRTRKLFDAVPEYERHQCWCYLEALESPTAYLVQAHGGEITYFVLHRNTKWYNTKLVPALKMFVDAFHIIRSCETLQDQLVTGDPDDVYERVCASITLSNI